MLSPCSSNSAISAPSGDLKIKCVKLSPKKERPFPQSNRFRAVRFPIIMPGLYGGTNTSDPKIAVGSDSHVKAPVGPIPTSCFSTIHLGGEIDSLADTFAPPRVLTVNTGILMETLPLFTLINSMSSSDRPTARPGGVVPSRIFCRSCALLLPLVRANSAMIPTEY